MAIRRGPLAEPTSATNVFAVKQGVSSVPAFNSGFTVDLALSGANLSSTVSWRLRNRLTNANYLFPNDNNTETSSTSSTYQFDIQTGYGQATNLTNVYSWMWKRAPSYFDVVAYQGTGSMGLTLNHNLGVAPEMIWVKNRSASNDDWFVYHSALGNTKWLELNTTAAQQTHQAAWNNTSPTATQFTVGAYNGVNGSSGYSYIAYLFASVAGVSKVGSYTGNGTSQNIDCGFSGNARFVLIKNASQSDNWMVYDSVRGINSGTEGYLRLNSTAAEYTSGDHIDPYSGGFAPTSNDPSTNRTGNTYIFYAIA